MSGTTISRSTSSTNGTDGFWTVTPASCGVTTRFTLTAGPGLTFDRSKVARSLSAVIDWMVSASPFTLTVVLVGALMTISPDGMVHWKALTVNVLNVGGF